MVDLKDIDFKDYSLEELREIKEKLNEAYEIKRKEFSDTRDIYFAFIEKMRKEAIDKNVDLKDLIVLIINDEKFKEPLEKIKEEVKEKKRKKDIRSTEIFNNRISFWGCNCYGGN